MTLYCSQLGCGHEQESGKVGDPCPKERSVKVCSCGQESPTFSTTCYRCGKSLPTTVVKRSCRGKLQAVRPEQPTYPC
jgi:hypothetical protein